MPIAPAQNPSFLPVRQEWLSRWREEIIEPGLPIVDPHHHLWDRPGWRYMFDDLMADLASGHNIIATVFVECRSMYRADGPMALRPIGETEFVNGAAAMSASGNYGSARVCAGIVGYANLLLGDAVQEVLEAQISAGRHPIGEQAPPVPARVGLWRIEPAELHDAEWIRALGSRSHAAAHFFNDPALPSESTRELFARWIDRCLHGLAYRVYALRDDAGQGRGFVIYLTNEPFAQAVGRRPLVLDFVLTALMFSTP